MILQALLLAGLPALGPTAPGTGDAPDFEQELRPLLEQRCLACHGGRGPRGGLSVETRDAMLFGGRAGPALLEDAPLESPLLQRVLETDPRRRMPRNQEPLTAAEVDVLRRWLEHGAPWPEGVELVSPKERPLELVPPEEPQVPEEDRANVVDRFLHAWCEANGVVLERDDDRRFARRLGFDLCGLPLEPERIERFVADDSPDKDAALVEELLADREAYAEHWLSFWNDLLRNAYRGTGFIDNGRLQITEWLYRSLYEDQPYDRFVHDLLAGENGAEGFLKGIQWRGVVNASQQPAMQAAQGVSKVFFGTKLQCASCHDSFVDPWKLEDAYSFAALFADGPLEIHRCDHPTGQIAEPRFLYPQLGEVPANLPRAERLRAVADLVTSPRNGRLARTLVQRLWARLFGQGLCEPLDDLDRPAFHPPLLEALAIDFVEHGQDPKHLLAVLCTSRAYRSRPVDPVAGSPGPAFRGPLARRLSAEEFVDAVARVTGAPSPVDDAMRRRDGRGQGGQWSAALAARGEAGDPSAPRAHWIWSHADAARSDAGGTVWLTTTFEVPHGVARAAVAATCDNEFDASLDGESILASTEWSVPSVASLGALAAGTHRLSVRATNWPDPARGAGLDSAPGSPAGFVLLLRGFDDQGAEVLRVPSDEHWQMTTAEPDGWPFPAPIASSAVAVADDGGGPWRLGSFDAELDVVAAASVRACLRDDDELQRALGRPNREQWVTKRDANPTLLMALELVNGKTLATALEEAAARWVAEGVTPATALDRLFPRALGRPANAEERAIALESLGPGERLDPEALADLMWAVTLLPEFQFLR